MIKTIKRLLLLGFLTFIFLKVDFEPPAKQRGDTVYWKNNRYVLSKGSYKEEKKIARGENFSLYSVGDLNNIFVGYRSFLDNSLYVREDFKVPVEGEITKLSWKGEFFTNKTLCNTIQKILENTKNLKEKKYESNEPLFVLRPGVYMGDLWVAYENTYITTEYRGYIGILNGNWVITIDNGNYVIIPEEYTDILEQHFKTREIALKLWEDGR